MSTTTNNTESRIYNLIILDESGSMDHIRMQALSGANETLQTIRMAQKENPADNQMVSFVTLIWADVREQLVTTNVMMDLTQIFGHTLLDQPMNIHNRIYCLDCARAFYLNLFDGLVYDQTTDGLVEESIEWAF